MKAKTHGMILQILPRIQTVNFSQAGICATVTCQQGCAKKILKQPT
jgi:hypothetical protein